jgi:hypothetical protein
MRRFMLVAAALMVGSLSLNVSRAQQSQQQTSEGEMEVTGIVTEANEDTREFTINDQIFSMPEEGGGAALFPAEGDEVTLYYRDEGGQKVVTRIGQPQQ